MPWLPMYLLGSDVEILLDHLDADEELAWVVGGSGRWRASARRAAAVGPRTALWHVPSGPLPLPSAEMMAAPDWIDDPWHGWSERRITDPDVPWFGPSSPKYYWLNLRTAEHGPIPISSFEWIGNRYRLIGRAADPATERHWRRLGRWAAKVGAKIPRSGPLNGPRPEVHAFPEALAAIAAGRGRAVNPGLAGAVAEPSS
jgi:hypothetical protein